MPIQFASALSTNTDSAAAIDEVCQAVRGQLEGPADLAMLFVSMHHVEAMQQAADSVCAALQTEALLGCTGESILGVAKEIESAPAVSLWAGSMPGVQIDAFHLDFEKLPDGMTFTGWPDSRVEQWPADSTLLLLGEPFSFPADVLLEQLRNERADLPIIGGMASGGWSPSQNRLILGRTVYDRGAVLVRIHGPIRVRSVVSQGCRPIGRHYIVTKAEQNMILELSGQPAMTRLHEVYETLNDAEKELVRHGLHVGRALSEYQDEFRRGDFLIRNVVGADPKSGAIAVGDYLRPGQTVQFHIRDAASADEDLRELLKSDSAESGAESVGRRAAGALLFTCNGRGTRLFPEPHHDAQCIAASLGTIPLAGFFAQGEIGPVGGKNFLHGFTASVAVFEEVDRLK
ncbi:MAG: FIST N-terminal domain-containing protein [Planctomycetota bacterium]|nr:FIST N-terminal domain-containing protein [Planctomycetota bacterium]